jgi:uncharacterized protein YndB with AHSA1/START domain
LQTDFKTVSKTDDMTDISLMTSITINITADKVWRALTDPKKVKKYFFGTHQITDWQLDSDIIWTGEWEGKTYRDHGKILDILPGSYLKYSYWSSMSGVADEPANYQYVSYQLKEENGVTTLNITQENIKDEAAKEHSEQNWQYIYGTMRDMLEQGELD